MTEKEYNECVTIYADDVFRFAVKNIKHEEDSRDIVQSAFEKLWVNRKLVDFAKRKSYLFTVAYHLIIDHVRKSNRVELKDTFRSEAKTQHPHINNAKENLQEALGRLNKIQKSLVLLKDYEGYSYEEIGEITGLSLSQVKVYLHRARLILKDYIVKPQNVL